MKADIGSGNKIYRMRFTLWKITENRPRPENCIVFSVGISLILLLMFFIIISFVLFIGSFTVIFMLGGYILSFTSERI